MKVFSDMSERLNYNLSGFPLFAKKCELLYSDPCPVVCHWHPDLEFLFVNNGATEYFVNGQTVYLEEGDGIFINSRRLHYNYVKDFARCDSVVVIIHPSVLGTETDMGGEYFNLKFGAETEDYCLLKKGTSLQKEVLTQILDIYNELNGQRHSPLRLISQAASLCAIIGENIQASAAKATNESSWLLLLSMTGFIQKNYANKINLDDISAAGSVCRSRCCQFFNKYVGESPIAYLTRYRLGKSCEMLRESGMSITEVALACGFHSSSYFTRVFKNEIGLTPKEYRKHQNKLFAQI